MDEQKNTLKETPKFDGISAQINLSPGSDTHRRFAEMMREAGATTARSFVEMLLDAYANPQVSNADDKATIANLEKQLKDARNESMGLSATCENYANEISELKKQLEAANNTANENATAGLGKQLQLDELQKQMEGAIIVKPNPVSAYFLNEMAKEKNTTPAKILERLFIDDLQNPRANNLPYTVSASRIREVMEELKPKP